MKYTAFLLILSGIAASCKEPEPEPKPEPTPEPTIELELGLYKGVTAQQGVYPNDMEFIDRENLATYSTFYATTVPTYYKYEIIKDSIKVTSRYGTTTSYFQIIHSTKFEIEYVHPSHQNLFTVIYEKITIPD